MRQSGILMHISSLPSDYGIGKFGRAAYVFINFLQDSGVEVWQILPLSPTSYGDSPYQSFSVRAGNPYFIDFEQLEAQGLLTRAEYYGINWGDDPRRVDYARIYTYCFHVLRSAFARFNTEEPAFRQFCQENADWLDDYALFMALKDAHKGAPWHRWEASLAQRRADAIEAAQLQYEQDIDFYRVLQFWFFTQWAAVREYAHAHGVQIVGDMPIYTSYDSVEVWAHPELFQLDSKHLPTAVAGCPPDVFSPLGQLWGNPLYNWDYHKQTGYAWWIGRLAAASQLYDTVRIDHFRGFESYYAIPFGEKTAVNGTWEPGPGYALFEAAQEKLGQLSIIAEDLGFLTPEVRALLKKCGYPGMKVLQFAFDGDVRNEYLPQNYQTTNCIVYTGTHDNMTLRGWIHEASASSLSFAKRYLHCRNTADLPAEILRAAWSSTAMLSVAQMQDFLDAGPDGRMNTPSTTGSNWLYRTTSSDFTPRLAKRIYRLSELYNRLPPETQTEPTAKRQRKAEPAGKRRNTNEE